MKDIDTDFSDIEKDNKNKTYIIVGILYVIVVILFVLLILGLKNQKDVVKDNIDKDIQVEDKVNDTNTEENKSEEDNIIEENNTNESDDEFNILNQI